MKTTSPKIESKIEVTEELRAGNRVIYPVIKIYLLKTEEGRVLYGWLNPLAMLIVEPGSQYAISFLGGSITLTEIVELAPALKGIIEKARDLYQVKALEVKMDS